MGKIPILKPQEVVRILNNLGFVEVRQKGSHTESCLHTTLKS